MFSNKINILGAFLISGLIFAAEPFKPFVEISTIEEFRTHVVERPTKNPVYCFFFSNKDGYYAYDLVVKFNELANLHMFNMSFVLFYINQDQMKELVDARIINKDMTNHLVKFSHGEVVRTVNVRTIAFKDGLSYFGEIAWHLALEKAFGNLSTKLELQPK